MTNDVVDAPPDLGGKLLTGIEEVTPKPITHLVYSHAHADHIGSAHLLARDGVKVLAHELTARFLPDVRPLGPIRRSADLRRPRTPDAWMNFGPG